MNSHPVQNISASEHDTPAYRRGTKSKVRSTNKATMIEQYYQLLKLLLEHSQVTKI